MNVDFFEKINERLKNERQRLLMTQVEIAEKCGVTPTTYSNYELGKRKPDAKFLQNFADIGGDVHFLFTGTRNKVLLDGYENIVMIAFNALKPEQKVDAISYITALGQGVIKEGWTSGLKSSLTQSAGGNVTNMVAGNMKK
ncbi:helix-turn-helix transcriptional regulator [Avibacterium paragallinarum]|uniref:helix-turn-helix domain-containing protein n=1 Tax=Avibacterium TaxID=292486 RepID=UPI002ED7B2F2